MTSGRQDTIRTLVLMFILALALSCADDQKETVIGRAVVIDVRKAHCGKGFYTPIVDYRLTDSVDTFRGSFKGRLERVYESTYQAGDSVYVEHDINEPKESRLIKVLYRQRELP